MFNGCSLLSDIKPIENWNVSNGTDFRSIFNDCLLLSNIKPLEKLKLLNKYILNKNNNNFGVLNYVLYIYIY